jgi:hypothetical protein
MRLTLRSMPGVIKSSQCLRGITRQPRRRQRMPYKHHRSVVIGRFLRFVLRVVYSAYRFRLPLVDFHFSPSAFHYPLFTIRILRLVSPR